MKNITNSVFPLDEIQKSDLIEPFKLSRSIAHNPKVLRYNWQSLALAEPRDNTNFKPPNGSLHRSSYKRLGPDEPKTGISETHKRLKEIDLKDDYISIFPHRSTMNMFSFNLTEDEQRNTILRKSGFELYPYNYGCTDYRTTTKSDYPLHFPMKPWPSSCTDKPWLFYRRTMSYTDQELSERNCIDKFYDENMRIHDKIAAMKLERYRSYDPISKEFTDPCKFAKYKFHASNYPTLLSLLLQQERYCSSLAGRK